LRVRGASKRISLLRLSVLLAGAWLTGAALADEIRVIQLQSRSAAEIIPLVQPLLGPEDAISGLDYRLIVRTSDARLREVERVIAQLDGAQRQLRLTVKHVLARDAARTLAELSGSVGVGEHARVSVPGSARRDDTGASVEARDGDDVLRARAKQESASASNVRTETLRVTEGQAAFIRTGQSVPYSTRTVRRHNGRTVVQETPAYDATSGFQVRPRVSGQRVSLEIAPRQASLSDARSGVTNIRELATTVQVPLGAWTDLGSVLGESNAANRAILQGSSSDGAESWTILVRVEDVTPGARPGTPAPPAPASRR
jgi:type II secretory pathway component GspD/PulD (secretin)